MIFLSLKNHQVKLLVFKKNIFSHYEVDYFEKTHQTQLLKDGQIINIDILASAIKEGLTLTKKSEGEKEVFLILPQDFFIFLRTEVPLDLSSSAVESYVFDKVKTQFKIENESLLSAILPYQTPQKKVVNFFGLTQKKLQDLEKVFSLLNLKITNIIPETLAYFKLFEKTLRKEKNEVVFYVHYHKDYAFGYLYDNLGLLKSEKWASEVNQKSSLEMVVKKEKEVLEKLGYRPNRLILSGSSSENIRQDTFTKAVGIWTNPLKKIIINFYDEYLKLLLTEEKNVLPILSLDTCFGAFVFSKENKDFIFLRKANFYSLQEKIKKEPLFLPKKDLVIFFISFISSILFFIFLSTIKPKITLPSLLVKTQKPSPTPTIVVSPSPTPTPKILVDKPKVRIKVLNGSGVSGKASAVKEILKEKGYQEILTGNADSFDYEKTEVSVKKEKTYLISVIEEDLKKYVSSFKIETLSDKEASDIIIVIGKDFK